MPGELQQTINSMALKTTNPTFRFLDLPMEIRLEVYGHYFKRPIPATAFDSYPFDLRPPPLALVCRQIHDDVKEHIHVIYGRENVFAVDNMYQGLTYFISVLDGRMRCTIRHIRIINFDFLCAIDITRQFIRPNSPDFTSAWFEGRHTSFNKTRQSYSRQRYFETIPDVADLNRTSRQYLPNLTTLTLDIGCIDHLTGQLDALWLQEPQHIRNRRYRVVIQTIEASLPNDCPRGLSIIVNAKMDPAQLADEIGAQIAAQRPILHVTLTFNVSENSAVHIEELLPQWQTVQDRGHDQIGLMTFPEVLVTRCMSRVEEKSVSRDLTCSMLFSQGYKPIEGFHVCG